MVMMWPERWRLISSRIDAIVVDLPWQVSPMIRTRPLVRLANSRSSSHRPRSASGIGSFGKRRITQPIRLPPWKRKQLARMRAVCRSIERSNAREAMRCVQFGSITSKNSSSSSFVIGESVTATRPFGWRSIKGLFWWMMMSENTSFEFSRCRICWTSVSNTGWSSFSIYDRVGICEDW